MDISLIIVIIVYSVLEYATAVWDSISNTDKQLLSRAFSAEISQVLCFFYECLSHDNFLQQSIGINV